jgi:hypothetical protein
MSQVKIPSTVRVACEVSFKVGNVDYGSIMVPAGTKVFRWVMEGGKVSDWFLEDEELASLCPNDWIKELFMHDAGIYGISLPDANVGPLRGPAKSYHQAHHY